jgi:predicted nucleotidyltransferase
MTIASSPVVAVLPERVERALASFVESAKRELGDHLRAVVLFGSAAEGRLRPTSDVNVVVVLTEFAAERVQELRDALRIAQAEIRLVAMFLLETEIPDAAEAFAVKFHDIQRRRRLLWGGDPFAELAISRAARLCHLRQILLNTQLRTREAYLRRSLRPEQLAMVLAESAGPLRTAAEALLDLEGQPYDSPKDALARVAGSLGDGTFPATLEAISTARETRALPEGADQVVFQVLELARRMYARAAALS